MLRVLLVVFLFPAVALAEAADPSTPTPVIFLTDKLDEPDNLGYCLDTVGRGRSDRMHIHSCKPRGGDVQFRFDDAGRIQSVAFPELCAEATTSSTLALLPCSESSSQQFAYDPVSQEIRFETECLVSSPSSRNAGPFMARDLQIANCQETPKELKQWSVRN